MLLNNVTLEYVRLGDNAGNKYMSEEKEWSVNIILDERQALEWDGMEYFPRIKEMDGKQVVTLRKPLKFPNGNANKPVTIVNSIGEAVDAMAIGNGTTANVQYSTRDWEFEGNKGTSADLVAVQVMNLKEFVKETVEVFEFDVNATDDIEF